MKEILKQNNDAIREAGQELIKIGKMLAADKIEEALTRAEKARQAYHEWEELDKARIDIESVIRERESMVKTQNVLADLAKDIIKDALTSKVKEILKQNNDQSEKPAKN